MPYIGNQHNVGDHVNNFKVLDDISSHTATFDGSATSVVSVADDTIRIPEHRFIQGQRVTYTNGGGGNIGGLTTGTAYFVSFDTANTIKLATTLANANSNTVINLSAVGSGTSHTLNAAFDGVNTKFKMTHGSGKAARLNNATQLNVAINNVIQRPNLDPNNFTDGFALQDNHKIVFKTAPTVNDVFWGSIIANTIENFDLRDNEVDNFTGDGSTTEFTLSTIPANNESVIVSINGVVQHPSDKNTTRSYTLIDSIIEFTAAPALNDEIQVRHIGFAGASTNDVSGFYGRTGNVALTSSDNITIGDIPTVRNINASGIITATTFDGAFSSSVGGSNANFTGIVTAGVFKGGDIEGRNLKITGLSTFVGDASFTGNVSIGGTLTYEDVTNIDSVGIITAQKDIHVGAGVSAVGVGTFSDLDISGDIDVDGHTNLDNVSIAGITTATGKIDANGDVDVAGTLDVDGHTNLDNVSIAGVTTTQAFNATTGSFIKTSNNYILVGSSNAGGASLVLDGDSNGDGSGTDYAYIEHDSSGNLNIVGDNPANAANITFKTNSSSEKLRITSDGKLGINYGSPVSIIHAIGNSTVGTSVTMTLQSHDTANATSGINLLARRNDNTNETCKIQAASGGQNSVDLQFHTNSGEKLRITSSGRAIFKLDAGSTNNTYHIASEFNAKTSGSAAANFGPALYLTSTFGGTTYAGSLITGQTNADVNTQDIVFYPRNYGWTEALRLASNGRVGIGTDNPQRNLDVYKSSANDCTISVRVKTAGAWFEANSEQSSGYYGLKFLHGNTKKWFIGSYGSNNLQLKIAENDASSLLEITSSGDVLSSGNAQLFGSNTSDGSDNKSIMINGGGAASDTRGGYLLVHGNEHSSNPGITRLHAGNVGTAGIEMYTAGSERLRITSTGLVGIGTAIPDQTLELFKASGTNLVKVSTQANSTVGLEIEKTGSTTQTWRIADGQTVNGALEFYDVTDSATRLMIDGSGRILINRTSTHSSVNERLSVNGMTSIQYNSTSTAPLYIFNQNTTADGTIQPFMYFGDGSGLRAGIGVQYSTSRTIINGQFGLSLRTGSSGVGGTERLFITSGGKIGIGEDDPESNHLLIRGSSTVATKSGHIMLTGDSATVNEGPQIVFSESGATSSYAGGYIGFKRQGSNSIGDLVFGTRETSGDANTVPTERLRIDSAGRIMTGGTANLNAKLQVSGRYVDASTSTLNLNGTGNDGPCLELFDTGNTANRIALMSFNHGSLKSAIGGGRANTGNWGTDLRFYTHKETTSDQYQVYEKMRIRPDGITTFGSSGSPYQSNTVSVHPDDGMVCFGMDGRSSLMSSQNSCYIFSGSGASGDIPAGTLILQSRSNVDRNIVFATGSTPTRKWQINGSNGRLEEFTYNTNTSAFNTTTGNGYQLSRARNGQVPTGNSGDTVTLFDTDDIADAGVYIMVIRSFEQAVTGGNLWSVRMVTSPFYIHSGSGNDGETVLIPYTYAGHANNATTQASNGQGPITLRIHFYGGSAHTDGRIRLTFNGFNYTGNNCDYYVYKLIDV